MKNQWKLKKYETILTNKNINVFKSKKSLSISETMNTEIRNIFNKKKIHLPRLKDVTFNHCAYIRALLLHWNRYHKKNTKILPIT